MLPADSTCANQPRLQVISLRAGSQSKKVPPSRAAWNQKLLSHRRRRSLGPLLKERFRRLSSSNRKPRTEREADVCAASLAAVIVQAHVGPTPLASPATQADGRICSSTCARRNRCVSSTSDQPHRPTLTTSPVWVIAFI